MKCEFIRNDVQVSLGNVPIGHEEQYEFREVMQNGEMVSLPFWKLGAILEHPDAWMLVQMGVARPADDGCAKRARMTPLMQIAAEKAYERVNAGIHPEDFELFDAGVILGYEPNGDYKPGPNFHLLEQMQQGSDDAEDE